MAARSWFRGRFPSSSPAASGRGPSRRRLRPTVLALEGRRLLSTFTVTNDTVDDVNTTGTLRWAIAQANAATSPSSIEIELGSTPATITLTQGRLELSNAPYSTKIYDGPSQGAVTVSGNNASLVFQIDPNVTASISGLTITGAGGAYGYGLRIFGTAYLTDCTVSGNSGGGLLNDGGFAYLTDCTVSGNSGQGGLYNNGTARLTDCTVSGNATGEGGGLLNTGIATLTNCTFSGNSATGGGGLFNSGSLTTGAVLSLTDCTFSGNSASLFGGGLVNGFACAADLINCTFSGNSTSGNGGGLVNVDYAGLTDCTFSGNSAGTSDYGGGLMNYDRANLTDCTVSGNSAGKGGGLFAQNGTVTLTNTIVAGNTTSGGAASDIGGPTSVSGSYNLIGTGGSGGLTDGVNHDQVGVANPGLDPNGLQPNGGPTQTIALLPGSPAIGMGGSVTTLSSAGVTDTSTSISVTNGLVFAATSLSRLGSGSYFPIQVGSEQMAVVGMVLNLDNSATLDVVRGATATAHPGGASVFLASDQRGYIRGSAVAADIGAFQDQGFVLTPVNGSTPQSAGAGEAFGNPLAVTVAANDTTQFTDPVDGGVIGFTVNPAANDASATLSAPSAVIQAVTVNGQTSDQASVTANANTVAGSYTVTASAAGASSANFSLTNNPGGQTINFTAPAPITFVPNATVTLSATGGGSGNPVVFTIDSTSTGAGSISGNTLTVTGAGTIVLDANQAGNSSYNAAPQVQQRLTVNTASQTINFTVTSPITFAPSETVSLTATGGGSGNPVVFTIDSTSTGTGSISGSTLTVTGAGTIVLDANQAGNSNYNAAPQVQQRLTVTPANTMTTLTSSANPAVPGQSVTFTAIIEAVAPGGGTPTGSVTFTSSGTTLGPVTYSVVGGELQASVTTSYASAGTPAIKATYQPLNGNYSGSSGSLTQTVLAPGVSVSGTTLYIVGGSTSSDTASVKPAGANTDGRTGLAVSATLNRVSVSKTFTQTFTAIIIAGYAGNETFTLAPTLTLPTTVTAGNGNDAILLGGGNNAVMLGGGNDAVAAGGGNDTVTAGNGNDVVLLGGGNDTIRLGGGNNTVTVGNGNDTIGLGDGSNVVVEGNGTDAVTAGNGNNLIVGGLGPHTIKVGNGTNILIDGSATVNKSGDSFRQILNAWVANPTASNRAAIRSRFTVNYNAKYANSLTAGSGIDWFFYQPPTTSNKKSTDFLN